MVEDRTESATPTEEIGYGAALRELEGILDEIEDDAVDVDVLAARVKRAAELLRVCRDRITAARMEIVHIVADMVPATPSVPPVANGDGEDPSGE